MAMMVLAPTSRAPWMTLSPTPPQPMTATVSPASTRAALVTEHTPVVTQQPMRAATSGRDVSGDRDGLLRRTDDLLGPGAEPRRDEQGLAVEAHPRSAVVHHLARGVVAVAENRDAAHAVLATAAVGTKGEDDVVARLDVADARAHGLHHARALMAQDYRGLVVPLALDVVQVAVADARGADPDLHLVIPGTLDVHIFDHQGGVLLQQYRGFHEQPPPADPI